MDSLMGMVHSFLRQELIVAKCEMAYVAELEHVNTKLAIYMMELGTVTNDLDKVSK